jgi:ketosteroid isomerase-like protein
MATVISPGTGRVSASFAAVAKHYGVTVRPCPPRRGNRKGVVEKANHVAAQRFWRTLADDATVEAAQSGLDTWCGRHGDARVRSTAGGKTTVGVLAAAEPLRPVPAPFPATLSVARIVSAQALVSFRGNRYSVPPELTGARVVVTMRLGESSVDIATTPGAATGARGGIVLARHRLAPAGSGVMVRDHGHVQALEAAAMAASTFAAPHRGKVRRPPSAAALDLAAHLPAATGAPAHPSSDIHHGGTAEVVDLGVYAAAAAGRNTLHQHHHLFKET